MALIADNLLFLENHSKGSIFHPLRVHKNAKRLRFISAWRFLFLFVTLIFNFQQLPTDYD